MFPHGVSKYVDLMEDLIPELKDGTVRTAIDTGCGFIAFFTEEEIAGTPSTLATTFLAFVLNLAFALSVLGFLIMHVSLVAGNTTTIEAYEKKTTPKWRYDLGRKRNFEQGPLQLLSLSGTFSHSESETITNQKSTISVTFAVLSGELMAATQIQVLLLAGFVVEAKNTKPEISPFPSNEVNGVAAAQVANESPAFESPSSASHENIDTNAFSLANICI